MTLFAVSRRIALSIALGLFLVVSAAPVGAQERGSREDAIAMAERAVQRIKEIGRDAAMAEFNDTSNKPFHERDLYVVAIDYEGKVLAHGTNVGLRGKNLISLKDVNSKPFVQEQIKAGQAGSGWTDYVWTDPLTKKLSEKTFYSIGLDGYYVGVGIYK